MQRPWTYRPESPEDPDWEDNAVSNTMAWVSSILMPSWCSHEDHWTAKVTGYLWAECSCCLSIRWLIVGAVLGFGIGLIF